MSTSCSLATLSSELLKPETLWNVVAILVAAVIAGGSAIIAASITMRNARALQDRERRAEEKSLAALLSADLHRKMIMLVIFLREPSHSRLRILEQMDTSTRVLEAALPKLGALGHQGAANLLAVFDGIALLMDDVRLELGHGPVRVVPRVRDLALHIGRVLKMLWGLYELDRPDPLEKIQIDLEAIGLKELKDLGF